jgi:nucleoside-diphosphate-sugar epimerase
LKLLVTGASGFIGRYVVTEALERGHEVRALVRPTSDLSSVRWVSHSNVDLVHHDLSSSNGLPDLLSGVEAVIHLAAVKEGDLTAQLKGTVATTENLLEAMADARVERLVLVSSLSVYDFEKLPSCGSLDESSPLECRPQMREPYCQSKLLQEELARRYREERGFATTILRPGVVIGPGQTWTDQIGVALSDRLWLRFTAAGMPLQLTYVENCAAAIVECTENTAAIGGVFNVVDRDLPSRRRYVRELRKRMPTKPLVLVVPGVVVKLCALLAGGLESLVFKRRMKLPWFARPMTLHVQMKPMKFPCDRIREVAGWESRFSLTESLDRCFDWNRE